MAITFIDTGIAPLGIPGACSTVRLLSKPRIISTCMNGHGLFFPVVPMAIHRPYCRMRSRGIFQPCTAPRLVTSVATVRASMARSKNSGVVDGQYAKSLTRVMSTGSSLHPSTAPSLALYRKSRWQSFTPLLWLCNTAYRPLHTGLIASLL